MMQFNEPTYKPKLLQCTSSKQEGVMRRQIKENTLFGRILVKIGLREPKYGFIFDVSAKFHRQYDLRHGDVVITAAGDGFMFVRPLSDRRVMFRSLSLMDECPDMRGSVAVVSSIARD